MNKILSAAAILLGVLIALEVSFLGERRRKFSELESRYKKAKNLLAKEKLIKSQLKSLEKEKEAFGQKELSASLSPLGLSRTIGLLASKLGISHISFQIIPKTEPQPSNLRMSLKQRPKKTSSISQVGLEMKAECDYSQLLEFIAKIKSLKTQLLVIKEAVIERKEDILPRQAVDLKLEAYAF